MEIAKVESGKDEYFGSRDKSYQESDELRRE